MTTHQELSGSTDEQFLERMVNSYPQRFDESYWNFFSAHVKSRLPEQPVVIDVGCGPGLFLRDVGERFPKATLYGYDLTPAMVEYANNATYTGAKPVTTIHNIATTPIPLADHSVHLVAITATLHVLDDPLAVLAEFRRLLAPGGSLLLYDWTRSPLQTYLESRTGVFDDSPEARKSQFRMFPFHNKYTTEDWTWLLERGGFTMQATEQLRPTFRAFLATVSV